MRLTFTDPHRPRDLFQINDRTDSKDPLVREGETFTVSDKRGRQLLAAYHPRLQLVEDEKPGTPANPIAAVVEKKQASRAGTKRAAKKS